MACLRSRVEIIIDLQLYVQVLVNVMYLLQAAPPLVRVFTRKPLRPPEAWASGRRFGPPLLQTPRVKVSGHEQGLGHEQGCSVPDRVGQWFGRARPCRVGPAPDPSLLLARPGRAIPICVGPSWAVSAPCRANQGFVAVSA